MNCKNHPLRSATASCSNCGAFICEQCDFIQDNKSFCQGCYQSSHESELYQPVSGAMRLLLYFVSFLIMPMGLIIGIIFYTRPNREYNRVGRNCIVISTVPLILYCVCFLAYFFFAFGGVLGSGIIDKALSLPAY